jgi:hypothetical protein
MKLLPGLNNANRMMWIALHPIMKAYPKKIGPLWRPFMAVIPIVVVEEVDVVVGEPPVEEVNLAPLVADAAVARQTTPMPIRFAVVVVFWVTWRDNATSTWRI